MDRVAAALRDLAVSPDEIANRTKLPIERIRALLAGAKATPGDLRALARGLRVPLVTFSTGDAPSASLDRAGIRFRSPGLKADGYEPVFEQVATFVDAALKILPKRDHLPDWVGAPPVQETYQSARDLAERFRSLLFPEEILGPVNFLPQRLERMEGLIISHLKHSRYEGASLAGGGYIFIFVSPRFSGRMLFTLAHEVGHVLAHHSLANAKFEKASQIGQGRGGSERFVDAFAGNLLIPDQALATFLSVLRNNTGNTSDELGDIEILYLSRFFGVSFDVAARRCEDLELLPRGGAVSLSEYLSKTFKSAEKRADMLGLPARSPVNVPILSKSILDPLFESISSGDVSPSWAADRLGVSVNQLYALNKERGDASSYRH